MICILLKNIIMVKVTRQGQGHIKVKVKIYILPILCIPYCYASGWFAFDWNAFLFPFVSCGNILSFTFNTIRHQLKSIKFKLKLVKNSSVLFSNVKHIVCTVIMTKIKSKSHLKWIQKPELADSELLKEGALKGLLEVAWKCWKKLGLHQRTHRPVVLSLGLGLKWLNSSK